MINSQQSVGLNELSLRGRGPDCHQGLAGKHRRALRYRPYVAGKAEMAQVIQKILLKQVFAPEVGDVVLVEVKILDVLHQLLQPCGNGKTAFVGHPAEEHVKIGDTVLHPLTEVAVGHGHLIKVKQHRQVQPFLTFHSSALLGFLS